MDHGGSLFGKLKRAAGDACGVDTALLVHIQRCQTHGSVQTAFRNTPPVPSVRARRFDARLPRPPPSSDANARPSSTHPRPHPPAAIKHVVRDSLSGGGASPNGVSLAPVDPFRHPGTLMGAREVALLRHRVAGGELPWADAAVALSSQTARSYRCALNRTRGYRSAVQMRTAKLHRSCCPWPRTSCTLPLN